MTWWEIIRNTCLFLSLVPPAAMAGITAYQDWLRDCQEHRTRRPITGYIIGGLFSYVGFVIVIGGFVGAAAAVILLLFGVGLTFFH